uniref:fibronectin type III domain-containing protein 1-like isoform X2 n=1 Tax=Myxine glutinosa TaxID=7769 RepID=UPI00358F2605
MDSCLPYLLMVLAMTGGLLAGQDVDAPVRLRISSADDGLTVLQLSRQRHNQNLHPSFGRVRQVYDSQPVIQLRGSTHRAGPASRLLHVLAIRPRVRPSKAQFPQHQRAAFTVAEMVAPPSNVHIRVLSPDSILVTWADPIYQLNRKQFGGLRRYYTVRYRERQVDSESWSYRTSARPRVRLENLTPNGNYEFSVRVSNGQRDGSWCRPVYQNITPDKKSNRPAPSPRAVPLGSRKAMTVGEPRRLSLKPAIFSGKRSKSRKVQSENSRAKPAMKSQITTAEKKPSEAADFKGRWMIDPATMKLYTPDGNMVYDKFGKQLKLCVSNDGNTVTDIKGEAIFGRNGSLPDGFGENGWSLAGLKRSRVGKPPRAMDTSSSPSSSTTATVATTAITNEAFTPRSLVSMPSSSTTAASSSTSTILSTTPLPTSIPSATVTKTSTSTPTTTTTTPFTYKANFTATPTWETGPISPTPSSLYDDAGKRRYIADYVKFMSKEPKVPCSITEVMERMKLKYGDKFQYASNVEVMSGRPENVPRNVSVLAVEGCHSFVVINWLPPGNSSITDYVVTSGMTDGKKTEKWLQSNVSNETFLPVENLQPNTRYVFKVQAKNQEGVGPETEPVAFVTESVNFANNRSSGTEPIWIQYKFNYDKSYTDCYGKQYVKRTWYRKFVGIVLCNSLRYKIFISDKLQGTFENIGDGYGYGEDHCEFVDSFLDGRTGPRINENYLPLKKGYYRRYRQQPLKHGVIGGGRYGYKSSGNYYVAWYECGAPIPGSW